MGLYNFEMFLNDFSYRTQKNLDTIYKLKNNEDVYEVTQLINSLFGSIILPYERYQEQYFKNLNNERKILEDDLELKQCSRKIGKVLEKCHSEKRFYSTYKYCKFDKNSFSTERFTFKDTLNFIKHIRNALSHGGNGCMLFDFKEDVPGRESKEYSMLNKIILVDKRGDNEFFYLEVNIEDELKELRNIIVDIFIRLESKHNDKLKIKDHSEMVKEAKTELKKRLNRKK